MAFAISAFVALSGWLNPTFTQYGLAHLEHFITIAPVQKTKLHYNLFLKYAQNLFLRSLNFKQKNKKGKRFAPFIFYLNYFVLLCPRIK